MSLSSSSLGQPLAPGIPCTVSSGLGVGYPQLAPSADQCGTNHDSADSLAPRNYQVKWFAKCAVGLISGSPGAHE